MDAATAVKRGLQAAHLLVRSLSAAWYARKRNIPGRAFDYYGRLVGIRLIGKGEFSEGITKVLNPLSIVRYWEFPFALRGVPANARRCLDVSSPRLFSLYLAEKRPSLHIDVLNPDSRDLHTTCTIARQLAIGNIATELGGADLIAGRSGSYDCIWSISVIEHIDRYYDDRTAIRWLYDALAPKGTLLLTFPVDRYFHDEYREDDPYGLYSAPGSRHFFQRYYDLQAIHTRLLYPIGVPPHTLNFFGEVTPGLFSEYEARWIREGLSAAVDDPREIADKFREFTSWEAMPGAGVCGLRLTKPD